MSIIKTTDPIYYNGYNILSYVPGWFTTGTDVNRLANKTVDTFDLPNNPYSATTNGTYNGKDIMISGILRTNGREALDSALSLLRRMFKVDNATLQLPVSGEQRYFYNCSVRSVVPENIKGGYAEITIMLHADDPYSYATSTTELLNIVNLTSGNKSYPVTVEGTASQLPIITFTVDSVTGGTNANVSFYNPSGKTIIVSRTWTANEVLVIDCKAETVKVDGLTVDYMGQFPEWESGSQYFNYNDTFTARQVDINLTYSKRYE